MYLNSEGIEEVMKNEMNLRTMVFLGYLPGRIGVDDDLTELRDHYYRFMKEKNICSLWVRVIRNWLTPLLYSC